jgi:photosystem II stability/assembly factor-like uncharacterized protein
MIFPHLKMFIFPLTCLFVLTAFHSASASQWVSQDISAASGNAMLALDGYEGNSNKLIGVGDAGTTIYTTNGGKTWRAGLSGTSNLLYDIDVISSSKAIAVGENGTVLVTTNFGKTWSSVSSGTSQTLRSIHMVDAAAGYIVGNSGSVLATIDGGASWTVKPSGITNALYGVFFSSTTAGWAVGTNETILHTTDSASTWTVQNSGGSHTLYDIFFTYSFVSDSGAPEFSEYNWAVGEDGYKLFSDDEGNTWSIPIASSGGTSEDIIRVNMLDGDTLFLTGAEHLTSTDGGANWVTDELSSETSFFDFVYASSTNQWLAAYSEDAEVEIYRLDITAPTDPSDLALKGGSPSNDPTPTLTWTKSTDNESAVSYVIELDSQTPVALGSVSMYGFDQVDAGDHTVSLYAQDEAGNQSQTVSLSFTITASESGGTDSGQESEEPIETQEESEAIESTTQGNLIKMACGEGAGVNDPCKAVYYYAQDGQRHAFTNEKVYFTWYEDFDDVIIVTNDFMASLFLGPNVTYHPGTKMVKFQTVHTVYAVAQGGVLRAIVSEELASQLYGDNWNQKIDDISDAFLGNYSFGEDITDTQDYDVEDAYNSVNTLSDNF